MTARDVLLWGTALVLSFGRGPAAGNPASAGLDLLRLLPPASSLEGWRVVEGPTEYVPDDLYEYLDGGAERFVTYGFRRLVHVRYQLGGDPFAGVNLDVFDMGDGPGAFGIYRSGLPAEPGLRKWGAEGHRTGTVAAAWKENIFVHAVADDDRAVLIEMLDRLVGGICDAIPGDTSLPAILDALPAGGLVPRSERHVAADLLGHAFLPGGVLATYAIEGREGRLFFSDLGGETAVTEAMARLRAHQERRGSILGEIRSIGSGGFRFSEPGLGPGIVVGAGRFLAGIHGDLPYEAQERLLEELAGNLGSSGLRD